MARGICLVAVQFKEIKKLNLRDDDWLTISKVWLDGRQMPDQDLCVIARADLANPLVVVNRAGVQVREIELHKAVNANAPVADCKIAEMPDLED